jgi:hypothetical protein
MRPIPLHMNIAIEPRDGIRIGEFGDPDDQLLGVSPDEVTKGAIACAEFRHDECHLVGGIRDGELENCRPPVRLCPAREQFFEGHSLFYFCHGRLPRLQATMGGAAADRYSRLAG